MRKKNTNQPGAPAVAVQRVFRAQMLYEAEVAACKQANSADPNCEMEMGHWLDISTFDRSTMCFVLVTEDGAVRLHLWNRNCWERAYPIGSIVQDGEDCSDPTHWMPCPDAPNGPS